MPRKQKRKAREEAVEESPPTDEDEGAEVLETNPGVAAESSSGSSASSGDEDSSDEGSSGEGSDGADQSEAEMGQTRAGGAEEAAAGADERGPDKLQLKSSLRRHRIFEPFYTGGKVSVSKDETWLACACGEETKVVNRNTGVVQATIPSDTSAVLALAWHPSKAQLAVSTASLQVKLWDIDLLQTGTSGEDEIGAQMRTEPATDS